MCRNLDSLNHISAGKLAVIVMSTAKQLEASIGKSHHSIRCFAPTCSKANSAGAGLRTLVNCKASFMQAIKAQPRWGRMSTCPGTAEGGAIWRLRLNIIWLKKYNLLLTCIYLLLKSTDSTFDVKPNLLTLPSIEFIEWTPVGSMVRTGLAQLWQLPSKSSSTVINN